MKFWLMVDIQAPLIYEKTCTVNDYKNWKSFCSDALGWLAWKVSVTYTAKKNSSKTYSPGFSQSLMSLPA